jgi:hypothetical protein
MRVAAAGDRGELSQLSWLANNDCETHHVHVDQYGIRNMTPGCGGSDLKVALTSSCCI